MKFSDADLDKDSYLSMEELRTLVMPTYHAHILEHLVTERLRRYDNNRDGFIDMDEYIGEWVSLSNSCYDLIIC